MFVYIFLKNYGLLLNTAVQVKLGSFIVLNGDTILLSMKNLSLYYLLDFEKC